MDFSARGVDQLSDKVGIQAVERLHRERLNFIVDDRAADLAQAAEDAFNNDLVAFMNLGLAQADHLERSGLVFQEKPVGRLPLAVGGELHVRDGPAYHDVLMIVLLRVCQQLGDFKQTCRRGDRRRADGADRQGC
ncbi:hypothetical protein NITLEN_80020 [Nitrospira lenta]|uniref:Uncharacterized protein n=1 Tax=Nitrospira lenta TaxID=1436998 RepID=A0A330L9H1_9BACT|nr:hypothetical protein NITLEN_80020 [Nitrospira lenta]